MKEIKDQRHEVKKVMKITKIEGKEKSIGKNIQKNKHDTQNDFKTVLLTSS